MKKLLIIGVLMVSIIEVNAMRIYRDLAKGYEQRGRLQGQVARQEMLKRDEQNEFNRRRQVEQDAFNRNRIIEQDKIAREQILFNRNRQIEHDKRVQEQNIFNRNRQTEQDILNKKAQELKRAGENKDNEAKTVIFPEAAKKADTKCTETESEVEVKTEAKPEVKTETTTVTKIEAKTEVKPVVKAEAKTE